MRVPALTFLAPPSTGDDDPDDAALPASGELSPAQHPRDRGPSGPLRMTHGARAAAAGMDVTDADVQRCLDAPDDVSPDPTTPSRTRSRRGDLVVLAAADGMVLRVERRRR